MSRSKTKETLTYEDIDKYKLDRFHLLINTTPVGTYPNTEDCLPIPYEYLTDKHFCFDLIYNPEKTAFLRQAQEQGAAIKNGLEMLEIQAEESWDIWTKNPV